MLPRRSRISFSLQAEKRAKGKRALPSPPRHCHPLLTPPHRGEAAECPGDNFLESEVSSFSPLAFFCFALVIYPSMIELGLQGAAIWPGLLLVQRKTGEARRKHAGAEPLIKRLSVCPHGHPASANRSGENNTTCSWRNSNGFSPPNNELCNLLRLPPEKELPMACTVPGGLEQRRTTRPNKGRFSSGCKDTTAALGSAGLPVTWPQPAFAHQDRDHYAIQSPQFPQPGQQGSPALLEMGVSLSVHPPIHQGCECGHALELSPASKPFSGRKTHCAFNQREKDPPGSGSRNRCSSQLKRPV